MGTLARSLFPLVCLIFLLLCETTPTWSLSSATYTLDGTSNSYLQFPSWHYFFSAHAKAASDSEFSSPSEVSLSFEFKVPPDGANSPVGGLLLYADDQSALGGAFLEVKLLGDSNLRVRIDDGGAVRLGNIFELRQEINFTDGAWHRLELIRHLAVSKTTPDDEEEEETVRLEAVTLKVDREVLTKKIELSSGRALHSPSHSGPVEHQGKSLFIGGLPEAYQQQYLAHLALPTVAYELHYRGAIRNVAYAASSSQDVAHNHHPQTQEPIVKSGLLSEDGDTTRECTIGDSSRCEHGGYCYNTQAGFLCDCSNTDFDGAHCQRERHVFEATFRGSVGEYMGSNGAELPSAWSFLSSSESFELAFRTKLASGLLLFSGSEEATGDAEDDYLLLALRDAGVTLTLKLGSVVQEKTVKPSKVRFDDNQWHTVTVARKIREISPSTYFCHFSLTVDGIYTVHGSAAGAIPYFISKRFTVGGMASGEAKVDKSTAVGVQHILHDSATGNFVGCLRKIVFTADTVRLDLLALVHAHNRVGHRMDGHQLANHTSHLVGFFTDRKGAASAGYHQTPMFASMTCQEVDTSDPVTFTTADAYLSVADGWNSPKEGSLSLAIRTNEPNGVLLYSTGRAKETSPSNSSSAEDYFALELLDGQLYLLQHLGSSPVKVKATEKRIDDSHWHTVTVRRSGRSGSVTVDETVSHFLSPGASTHLDLGDLYLGGYPRFTGERLSYTPPALWSASSFGYGYIGCVRDLTLNDRPIDLAALARRQDSGSVTPSCHSSLPQCPKLPCQNGGTCSEGWNRYECNCAHTPFTGSVCAKNAATLSFNGEQYWTVNLPEELHTQSESVYLRFRTKKPRGLLLTTTHPLTSHYLTLYLESGSLRVDLNYGEGERKAVAQIGTGLGDDTWHTVHLQRRGHSLEVALDQSRQRVEVELTGQEYTLRVGAIHVGALLRTARMTNHGKHQPGFEGFLQNLIFNGQAYFEKARDGQLSTGSIKMTATVGKKDRVLHNVATFKSKYTFVGLPQLKAYSRLNLYFQFKTREANGLLFYNGGGQRHDFIALELVSGQLHYLFDLGDGPRRLQSKAGVTLSDNRWHSVTLGRPSQHKHTMLVDDSLMSMSTGANADRNQHLDLNGLLYFGGVRDSMWPSLPKAIKSKSGFEGCIASLDLNGETFSLVGSEVLIASTLVESGCSAPVTRCSSTACANRGVCVQLWNSYTCDCDLTTFSGPTCADESTAYQFGPLSPGLITFTFEENNRPDTRNDLLALGFLTTQKNGALVRIDSGTSPDYLQLELLDGNVLAVYNLGSEDIDIGELGIAVNDGKYHIVRLTRSGQNATLQIDNHNVITRSPTGRQMNIFNSHAKIEIGGHKNVIRGTIEKPFAGILAGLVFNSHRLLDMAAMDDPRVNIEGAVELMISIGNQNNGAGVLTTPTTADRLGNQMLAEPKSHPSGHGHNDDLIYSGQGSGCFDVHGNDDEECTHMASEGSGDDLITPVYVAVNRLRPTTPASTYNRNRPNVWREGAKGRPCPNDDDDECVEGSGAVYEPESSNAGSSNYSIYENSYYHSTTSRSWTTWVPPTVSPMNRPPLSPGSPPYGSSGYPTVPPYYYGNEYGNTDQQLVHLLRPKTTAPSWTKPIFSVSHGPAGANNGQRPPATSGDSQTPPEIFEVPLNIPPVANDTVAPTVPEVLTRSSNERTVMIIGMIAICLIVVVIIAPIVLFFKVRLQANDAAYKVETFGGHKFGATLPPLQGSHGPAGYPPFGPVARATSVAGIPGHPGLGPPGMMQHNAMNTLGRASRAGTRPGTPTERKKDPHEWYV